MRKALLGLVAIAALAFSGRATAQADETPRLTRPPATKKFVEPHYPETAGGSGRSAEVLLSLEIGADGLVVAATVLSPAQPGFDEAALEAARQLEFIPAEVDGKPAAVRITYRYRFTPAPNEAPAGPALAPLRGRVVFRDGGGPAANVEVRVRSLNLDTRTAAAGNFTLSDLEPGVYLVELSGQGIVPTAFEQRVPAADPDGVIYEVVRERPEEQVDEEIVIRLTRLEQPAGGTAMDTERARQVPGVMGDALNVVQTLPGVSSVPSGSGELVVWGAAPSHTRILIDDVPVPALYHKGGFRSILHDGLVSSVEVIPAGFGPEYGHAVGGIIRVHTAALPREGVHGELGADLIGASALLAYRPSSTLVLAGAGRVGYLDQILPRLDQDVEDVVPISAYRDYAAKARLSATPDAATELLVFGSFDDVERRLPSADPRFHPSEHDGSAFHRTVISYRRQQRQGPEDRAQLWAGFDRSRFEANFDNVSTELEALAYRLGGRASRRFSIGEHALTLGLDFEGSHSVLHREGTLGLPAREGDSIAFGQAPAGQVAADEWTVDLLGVGGYLESDLRFADGSVEVSPGLRVEPIVQGGDRAVPTGGGGPPIGYSQIDLALGPRLAVKVRPGNDDFDLHAATGVYHQPPAATDRSPVFGGTKLGLTQAVHGLVGAALRPGKTEIEVVAFNKYSWNVVSRSQQEPPPIAGALVNDGQARAYGAQLVLRRQPYGAWSGWVSYALTRSERRDQAEAAWRLSDHDQTHALTAVASYSLGDHWDLGARLRAASGLPRTEVTSAYYDSRLDRYQPQFAEHNGIRLPPTFQLDLHAEYDHDWDGVVLSVYLDLINVTGRRNPIEIVYSDDYTETAYLTSLPTLAILGARVEF